MAPVSPKLVEAWSNLTDDQRAEAIRDGLLLAELDKALNARAEQDKKIAELLSKLNSRDDP